MMFVKFAPLGANSEGNRVDRVGEGVHEMTRASGQFNSHVEISGHRPIRALMSFRGRPFQVGTENGQRLRSPSSVCLAVSKH